MANVSCPQHFANLSGKTQCCKEGVKAVILNGSTPQLPFSSSLAVSTDPPRLIHLEQPTMGAILCLGQSGRTIPRPHSAASPFGACVVFEHLSTSTVPKVLCPKCGLRFCEDLDPVISTDDQSIREIRSLIDEKQPDQTRIQSRPSPASLRFGCLLGTLESPRHGGGNPTLTIHQSEGRLKSMSKNLNKTMKELVYQDVPGILAELPKDDFALLSAYQVDFTRIRSDSVFEDLADEANDRFDEVTRSELMNPICVFINLLGGFSASFTIPHHMFGRSTESDAYGEWLRLVRLQTSAVPVSKGQRRISRWSLNMCQAGTLR
ncbi:hypothetical protein BKA70DRAFT_1237298 [Coprinopsis sp. MPI-PUGE-AT-0042]|nr:hypothetical protein BKA70DRAFT_1237298 [Coprinopsis sp. MPI-PUGE-AT-0042]